MSEDLAPGAVLDGLWAVQEADSRLAGARTKRAALDDGTSLRAEVEAARAVLSAAVSRLHDAQAALRDRELALKTAEAKQKKAEGDLYGGRVSNPKELASLEEDIGILARARDRLEDEILALFDKVEQYTAEAAAARGALDALETRLVSHLAQFEEGRDRLDAEIAALAAGRQEAAAAVEPRLLRKYEGIAAREGGVGMVAIIGGFCGGCRNDVPAHFVSRIREGHVVTCERCHRILYLREAA
jgi:uncharacterized protein